MVTARLAVLIALALLALAACQAAVQHPAPGPARVRTPQ